MRYLPFTLLLLILLVGCNTQEATERERTNAVFLDSLNGNISPLQWWETAVTLKIEVTTEKPIKMWLLSSEENAVLYDYKEIQANGTVVMTAPQGQGNNVFLVYKYNNIYSTEEIYLSGKPEETITINTKKKQNRASSRRAASEELSGNSIMGENNPQSRAQYYEFEMGQLFEFLSMMNISKNNTNAKDLGLNCNYELESNGPFSITWVNGHESSQLSRILGYYYHSPGTYEDLQYVDISETHRWDYIDGLAKVQYKIAKDDVVDGHTFKANTWYDANFDLTDKYGSTPTTVARRGDNCYNMQEVFNRYKTAITGLRGISFDIDVPEGMHIGFYLRSDTEPYPMQWQRLKQKGIKPYTNYQYNFMGTCFSAEALNVDGLHRSFIMDDEEVVWMGMEDIVEGGDYDCNDVIFGVVTKLNINYMPDIITPTFFTVGEYNLFPWTLAFEDVNRGADFDFNDAVIKLVPDYENEQCCVTVMAAGSTARMILHYDGPDGDKELGEIHELLGSRRLEPINTKTSIISTPFVEVDCVPWPRNYTMTNDARRFYIEIQRGTCADCTDVISLPSEPGQLPEALLVAGEWRWPTESTQIFKSYNNFPNWAKDGTRTRFWEWYAVPSTETYVSY